MFRLSGVAEFDMESEMRVARYENNCFKLTQSHVL